MQQHNAETANAAVIKKDGAVISLSNKNTLIINNTNKQAIKMYIIV